MPKASGRKPIEFSKEERAAMIARLQDYFSAELDTTLGSVPADLLLNFLADDIGAFFYNRGLADAQALFRRKLDDIDDEIYGLERRDARVR